ncbi:MAG: DNA-directed RNA polymerase subunit beta' [bacterium]|nr:DNA-directed RNA polymerase subunit beta' [bacterium]
MRVTDLQSLRIKLASPDDILSWSFGEVTKPETINYRTQRAEKDGLFDERIFGPEKDFECYCGKYKKIRYKGITCDRCGVEVTKASVRRERMGHIKLATPCSHIWFLRGIPSRISMVFDIPMQNLERVIYFGSYIVTKVDNTAKTKALGELEQEFLRRTKGAEAEEKEQLKEARDRARHELASIEVLRTLSEIEYQTLSLKYGHVFEAGTGSEVLRKIAEQMNLKDIIKRLLAEQENASPQNRRKLAERIRLFRDMFQAGIRPEWMFLSVIPVLPPDLRPMVQLDGGRYASSDLNDLYRRVINRNNRLRYLLDSGAPDVIVRNEKRMLQEAVDALIDNSMRKGTMTQSTSGGGKRLLKSLSDMLKGKQGRFRGNLLGKRVDYSGRSVIVAGPELKLHQCGLPKLMALELFKPFVIQKILERELSYNVKGASRLIEQGIDEVWEILEEVVKDRVVLLNRAPTLHRLGIQGFYPLLMEGEAIRLHPLVCSAFNADFDGDQMAVHVPLSDEAQREAREIMLSGANLLKPATGLPIVAPEKDMVLGCFYLTGLEKQNKQPKTFSSEDETILAYEHGVVGLRDGVRVLMSGKLEETTPGRIIFNRSLPEGHEFINSQMNKKSLGRIIGDVINTRPPQEVQEVVDRVKELGFEYATKSGITWGMDDLIVPKEKPALIKEAEGEVERIAEHFRKGLLSREERSDKVIEIWTRVKVAIEKLVPKTLSPDESVSSIIDSGSRGSWSQATQMAGMRGLMMNPAGRLIELPIKSCFKEGLDVLEYFISTHGTRKGTADTALRTATAGYLTRRLVDVSHDVIITNEDCKDTKGIVMRKADAEEVGQNPALKFAGRVVLEDIAGYVKKNEIIGVEQAREIAEDDAIQEVRVRSALSCKNFRGLCQKCYGWDLGRNAPVEIGSAVGIVAAQSIGEPGTQLTMRTFHTGGVAGGGDITQGLPRVEEIFEGRVPGGKAVIAECDGVVVDIVDNIVRIRPDKSIVGDSLGSSQDEKKNEEIPGKKKKEKKEKEDKIAEYEIPANRAIWVQQGGVVVKGQQLCEGNLDLQEILAFSGTEDAQRYVVKEVQRIYSSQGVSIHDKHLEVIVRQMFSRVRIKEKGESKFLEGEVVERPSFLEENAVLEKADKKKAVATQLLLGISRVALTTESFLSAASFQETSRVLIRASLSGKEDKLRGLKENVIIGKLIPVGKGFKA